ncbi:ABC transporter permease [Enterococcus sp. AZ192]|uniref:ABC transporter permease n=1 Tax=unclassified Enterococcus TaxID=2608891 RepID=UPI003D2D299D
MFYVDLALTNLKKNRKIYLPFLLSMVFLVVINVILQVLVKNKGMNTLPSTESAKQLFGFGQYVILIFTIIFSLYTNSFLLKQRKKELGLYNILGMGKKELRHMLFCETVLSYFITIVCGTIIGSIFAKFCFLALKKMTQLGEQFIYDFSFQSILYVIGLFFIIYILLFSWNVIQLRLANPIELLQGSKSGEKEPKTKVLTAIIGLLCVGSGYYISVTIQSPISAIYLFFIAVVLVIIGTYALFTASSIAILKSLKKNKRYYYRPNHFISVSSMIYRMKQNAAGLASICILCTMVLVTIATTASLYFGMENVLQNRNPFDMTIGASGQQFTKEQMESINNELVHLAEEQDVKLHDNKLLQVDNSVLLSKKATGIYEGFVGEMGETAFVDSAMFTFITEEEYNRLTGEQIALSDNEIAVYMLTGTYKKASISIADHTYKIKKQIDKIDFLQQSDYGLVDTFFMIFKDKEQIAALISSLPEKSAKGVSYSLYANLEGSKENRLAFGTAARELLNQQSTELDFSSIDLDREDSLSFVGGFLFMGIIFGLTFTLAAGVIIYYKQVSEGTEDQGRYDIMQRVGMSHQEVQQTIRSQILMVFFFPIGLAALHLAFAFPLMRKLLVLFGLTDWKFFMLVCFLTVFSFFFLYLLMYWQTSKVYYQIVERKVTG